jgi:hypothetical protein
MAQKDIAEKDRRIKELESQNEELSNQNRSNVNQNTGELLLPIKLAKDIFYTIKETINSKIPPFKLRHNGHEVTEVI